MLGWWSPRGVGGGGRSRRRYRVHPGPVDRRFRYGALTVGGHRQQVGCRSGRRRSPSPGQPGHAAVLQRYLAVAAREPAAQRRNCQILLRLDYPWDEYTAAVSRVRSTGYAEIAEGATGEVRAQDFLAGTSRPPYTVLTIPGPVSDWWQLTDSRDQDQQVWLPCGEQRNLNFVSALRVMPDTSDADAASYLSLDEPVRIDLAWQRC